MLIDGDGFSTGFTTLQFGTVSYTATNAIINYNQISLITSSSLVGAVALYLSVNGIFASCTQVPYCSYQFSSLIAPTISSISPTSVSSGVNITISGTQFGYDSSQLNITIGSQICNITELSNSTITCYLSGLSVGSQTITVNLLGKLK